MADSFAELRAAAIDGRTHNIYYRQHQLEALHQALLDHASEIRDAIAADYDHSPAEVAVEINLALSALNQNYETLQPTKAHAEEYLIASGHDAPASRIPAGIAYIEPCTHTLFFSVIAPLSAAIAAGNVVIVLVSTNRPPLQRPPHQTNTISQLENNLRTLTSVLRQTLTSALHPDTFAIASSAIRDPAILKSAIHIDQNNENNETYPKSNHLASPARSRVFAIVDRTADVKLAARELVASRFAFGGSSPYAPDLVLVNEFVKQDFLQAVREESRKVGANGKGDAKGKRGAASRVSGAVEALKKADSRLQVVVQEASTTVVELTTRRAEMLEVKTDAPVLTVHAVKSLDDAIDFIGSAEGPALAAYHFGNPQVGKYLAQFVDARVSFVNQIPRKLLVGPAHPASYAVEPSTRYTVEMFTLARPAFIQAAKSSDEIAAVLTSTNPSAAQKLLEQAFAPLVAMKRKPGGGVGMLSHVSIAGVRSFADTLRSRFLRARLPHERRHDPNNHHQRHGSRDDLAGQEREDSFLGVQSLSAELHKLLLPCSG